MIEDLEATKDGVEDSRRPNKTSVVPYLVVWDTDLIVLNFFVNVVKLEVEFVDHWAISEVAATFGSLATGDVDAIQDLVHWVRSMHFQQVLVDRKELSVFNLFDQIWKVGRIPYLKLLLWVFVLLHVEPILNHLIPFHVQLLVLTPEGVNQAHLLFQVEWQPEKDHDSNRVRRIENHHNARDLRLLKDETQRNWENEEVQEQKDFGSTHGWPVSPILE